MPKGVPTLRLERQLLASGTSYVLACDEVGRGAIAGPVTVAVVAINPAVKRMPAGLRDSKLLPESRRELLAPRAASWVSAWGIGNASATEIDRLGIMACLGLAGARAFTMLRENLVIGHGNPLILDGNYDWLSAAIKHEARVITKIKADRDCASVAAASVIAKVHRDRGMRAAHVDLPEYGWDENKGYSTRAHFAAIDEHGASPLHRHTWLHPERKAGTEQALFDLSVG